MQKFKTNTAWKNTSSIMKRWVRNGEDLALAFRTHPLESTGWLLGFVSVLVILCIVLTNRLDIIVTLSDELYQAIPKVFK